MSSSVPSCTTTPLTDEDESLTPPALTSISSNAESNIESESARWLPVISCPAEFPKELFEIAALQIVHHPEHNSTLILRSDTVADYNFLDSPEDDSPQDLFLMNQSIPKLKGFLPTRCVHRKLLPRRPGRDEGLEQLCTLYAHEDDPERIPIILVLTPILQGEDQPLPYYHPPVRHIAFRFTPPSSSSSSSSSPIPSNPSPSPSTSPATTSTTSPSTLRIEAQLLLLSPPTNTSPTSRFYRTSLALIKTLHRYAWGALTNYQKRVLHDCLIPRDRYQDLYLVMRERYKGLVKDWVEVTDPLKHVFEDIGIATYLMLLWKDTFSSTDSQTNVEGDPPIDYSTQPWRNWGRPPGGFLDFGCGNGLLTHILVNEGYDGYGVDLRSRTSWSTYPLTTQSHLHVYTFDPSTLSPPVHSSTPSDTTPSPDNQQPSYFKAGTFLIGNHADELTPWLPIISRSTSSSGYLSIPCCAWSLDSKFERSSTPRSFPHVPNLTPINPPESSMVEQSEDRLRLGGVGWGVGGSGDKDKNWQSSYTVYRIWLAGLSEYCGWEIECDTLRIPSSRNWAIVGRRASKEVLEEEARRNVEEVLEYVKERGLFRARKPEGSGEH
ncbi:DUF1613-domain-containing protein [Pluteus cervinus]|uniref:DUF1613-domain-containing protein n=1 Tax=Pluteus cervinus TaxID=181527 RepID=A0ACD3A7N1_9AGAR|nr:DUF1613-domain-containing protein [Pluteus cervinus]